MRGHLPILTLCFVARAGAAEPLCGLSSGNSKHIQSLMALVATLHSCLEPQQGGEPGAPQILTVNDFLFSRGLDNLNLFRLIRYVLRQHRENMSTCNIHAIGFAQQSLACWEAHSSIVVPIQVCA